MFFFFSFNVSFLGDLVNSVFFSNFSPDFFFNSEFMRKKLSFFFISESIFFTLPKRYMFLILNVRTRVDAIKLVKFWVINNLLLLPEWKYVLSSYSYSTFSEISVRHVHVNRSFYFFFLKCRYVCISSFSFSNFSFFIFFNVFHSISATYFSYLKFFLFYFLLFFLSFFLLFYKIFFFSSSICLMTMYYFFFFFFFLFME